MSADNTEKFIGFVKPFKFDNGGEVLNISFKKDDIERMVKLSSENESGFVNLQLKESKSGKKYMEINTWKPKSGAGGGAEPQYTQDAQSSSAAEDSSSNWGAADDGLPF